MKIKIKVTKEILQKTKMCSPGTHFVSESCAVAEAVRDIFPNAQVNGCTIDSWVGGFHRPDIHLPHEAKVFIWLFDNLTPEQRVAMNPITFEIDVPEETINEIGIQEVENILSKSLTLEKA